MRESSERMNPAVRRPRRYMRRRIKMTGLYMSMTARMEAGESLWTGAEE